MKKVLLISLSLLGASGINGANVQSEFKPGVILQCSHSDCTEKFWSVGERENHRASTGHEVDVNASRPVRMLQSSFMAQEAAKDEKTKQFKHAKSQPMKAVRKIKQRKSPKQKPFSPENFFEKVAQDAKKKELSLKPKLKNNPYATRSSYASSSVLESKKKIGSWDKKISKEGQNILDELNDFFKSKAPRVAVRPESVSSGYESTSISPITIDDIEDFDPSKQNLTQYLMSEPQGQIALPVDNLQLSQSIEAILVEE